MTTLLGMQRGAAPIRERNESGVRSGGEYAKTSPKSLVPPTGKIHVEKKEAMGKSVRR